MHRARELWYGVRGEGGPAGKVWDRKTISIAGMIVVLDCGWGWR